MIAIKEFRYYDHARGKSVLVRAHRDVDVSALREAKVDVDKLARVGYVGREEAGAVSAPPRKRGRPRKATP